MENTPHTLNVVDIYGKDKDLIGSVNPINQIPVLKDDDKTVIDSRQIFNYLNAKHNYEARTLEDDNFLYGIEGCLDAGVALFLLRKSGLDINSDLMYVRRLHERIDSFLNAAKPFLEKSEWNFNTVTLYCFLDWANIRKVSPHTERPEVTRFLERWADREILKATAIPENLR